MKVLLGLLTEPELVHEIADECLGQLATQRRDRLLRGLMHRVGLLDGEIGDLLEGGNLGLGDAFGSGILVEQLEHPARSCPGQGGEFGEDPGQEVVQSVDGLSRLLDLGLQPSGDFANRIMGVDGAGVALGSSTTAKRAMAWLSVSSVVRLGKWAFW